MLYQETAKTCMGYGNRDNLSGLRREDILKYRSCRKSFAEENFNKKPKKNKCSVLVLRFTDERSIMEGNNSGDQNPIINKITD